MNRNAYRKTIFLTALLIAFSATALLADGPKDNIPSAVRPIPPIGKELPAADRESIQAGLDALGKEIDSLADQLKQKPELHGYLPDVQIYYNAVHYPLVYHETLDPADARKALADGMARAMSLRDGKTPWINESGPRGYVSRIDGSVQPYRVLLPADYSATAATQPAKKYRLDVWGHGRDELLTELRFVVREDPLPDLSYLKPYHPRQDKFVLACYGRYITAFKFAGEIDVLEAMAVVKKHYPIDDNRVLVIGFSMGGAMCWEFAVHYTDLWTAASPGAGFAETEQFLKVFQKEDVSTSPWYERVLYHLYDCTDYAANLSNLPTFAYGGELDPQKQASNIMTEATDAERVRIKRFVGWKTPHRYELQTKQEMDKEIDAVLDRGRDPVPPSVRLETWTLRYNKMYWVTVDAVERHWKRTRVDGSFSHGADDSFIGGFNLKTENVTRLSLSFPAGLCPFEPGRRPTVVIDGSKTELPPPVNFDKSWVARFVKANGKWTVSDEETARHLSLSKVHGLQGPIDDAFLDHFIIVRPTGKPLNEKTGAWEKSECDHAIDHWRKQFRGEAIVKNDDQVADADIAAGNLILFGDPSSNALIGRILAKLPVSWDAQTVKLGEHSLDTSHHVPVLIYPNPLYPDHYVVINSGFTYREYDYLNNARQTPKLPDFAVIDVDVPVTSRSPGGIAAAGFFGEKWELLPDDGKSLAEAPAAH